MDSAVETLFKENEESLKLFSRHVLCSCEKYPAVIRLVIDEINQITVSKPIPWRHRTFQIRTDDSTDSVNGRVKTTVRLVLGVSRLFILHARNARHALAARQPYPRGWVSSHALNGVECQMPETLMEM